MNFWIFRGYVSEGRKSVEAALAKSAVNASDVAQAHALYVGAALAASQSDYASAQGMLQQCLSLRRAIGSAIDIAATLSTLSVVELRLGNAADARAAEEEALAIFRDMKHPIGEALGLLHIGQVCAYLAEDDEARRFFDQCVAIARQVKHCEIESEGERMLGEIALEAGDVDGALSRFDRSLQVCRGAGDKRDEASSAWWLARVHLAKGELDRARELLAESLRSFQSFEMHEDVLNCLEDHGRLFAALGAMEEAVRLYALVARHRVVLGVVRSPRVRRHSDEECARARAALGDADFDCAWSEGMRAELGDVIVRTIGAAPAAAVAA